MNIKHSFTYLFLLLCILLSILNSGIIAIEEKKNELKEGTPLVLNDFSTEAPKRVQGEPISDEVRLLLSNVFPSEDFMICKENVTYSRVFVNLFQRIDDPSLEEMAEAEANDEKLAMKPNNIKIAELLFQKFNESMVEEHTMENFSEKDIANAERLIRAFCNKLVLVKTHTADDLCHWVEDIYAGREKVPFLHKLTNDGMMEITIEHRDL
mmetsp:Transcript_1046/g.1631  ORF Transcript_1046/g.1631 Transcript_1046/m.1631 type:complete len:210 (+) Transcript_1046:13-642(+)